MRLTRLGWSLFFRRVLENWVETPLWFQNAFRLLSITHGIDRTRSGRGWRCEGTATCSESCLWDCVFLAWLPEARSSSVHPSSSPMLAFKRQGEVAWVSGKCRGTRSVRGHERVKGHIVGGRDPILPVDVASQQRRGAFRVWKWRAVTHAFLKAPVHPPVVGNVLYCSPLVHSHGQQPVDQCTCIWRKQQWL